MRLFRSPAPLMLLVLLLAPGSAGAAFHLNEFTQILVAYNGDNRIQAVQLRSLVSGENLVSGASVKAYDGAGNLLGTGGTFSSNLANATAGAPILCATRNFEQTFGITADLQISNVLPVTDGQVSFETSTCLVDAVAYGNVTVIKDGPTSAPPLPGLGATALIRVVDNGTIPSCPQAEDSYGHFRLVSGDTGNPLTFTNNSGQSVTVASTAAAVEASPLPAAMRVLATPNPASGRVLFSASAPGPARLRVFTPQGRLVWETSFAGAGRREVGWDGADRAGGRAPSGIYLLQLTSGGVRTTSRFLFLR